MKRKTVWVPLLFALFALPLAGCGEAGEVRNYTVTMLEAETAEDVPFAEVLEKIRPSVVDVTSYAATYTGAGSGVVIASSPEDNQYFIITNHHVIDGGSSFAVDVLSITDEGETTVSYDAALIGSSMKRDVAVLSVRPPEGTELSVAAFISDSDGVKVGTEVFAIGNPLGILGGTVTHGIVSATKREVSVAEIGTMTLLQTDASINGGNSGGGLFDTKGNLVGIINSGYDSYNGQSVEGLNFAIPANDARYAAESLIETHAEQDGKIVEYGYVGGDARMDLSFSTAALYTSSAATARGTYIVASVSSTESPFYEAWGENAKAVVSVTVNGTKTDFSTDESGSYSMAQRAGGIIAGVKAGDVVTIEYRDILTQSMGGPFGGLGFGYQYLGGGAGSVTVTAEQYIYKP